MIDFKRKTGEDPSLGHYSRMYDKYEKPLGFLPLYSIGFAGRGMTEGAGILKNYMQRSIFWFRCLKDDSTLTLHCSIDSHKSMVPSFS